MSATGVDYLAVGALTHSAPLLDLGFDLRDTRQTSSLTDSAVIPMS